MIISISKMLILAQATSPLNQTYVISVTPSQIITVILIGLIGGFVANLIIRGRGGFIASLAIGILGAVVGNFLFALLQVPQSSFPGGIMLNYYDIVASFVGAVILLILLVVLFGRRFR